MSSSLISADGILEGAPKLIDEQETRRLLGLALGSIKIARNISRAVHDRLPCPEAQLAGNRKGSNPYPIDESLRDFAHGIIEALEDAAWIEVEIARTQEDNDREFAEEQALLEEQRRLEAEASRMKTGRAAVLVRLEEIYEQINNVGLLDAL